MKTIYFILAILIASYIKVNAQGWLKPYGSINSEYGNSFIQTDDNGYIIVGSYNNGNDDDVFIIKTDANGELQWDRKIGDSIINEKGFSLLKINNNSYFICGNVSQDSVLLIKIDIYGNLLWKKTYFHQFNTWSKNKVIESSNNEYFIVGQGFIQSDSTSFVYIIKTDSLGNELEYKSIGADFEYFDICQLNDTVSYILSRKNYTSIYIFKLNNNLDTIWSKSYSNYGYPIAIKASKDNMLICLFMTSQGLLLKKFDQSGIIIWSIDLGYTNYYPNSITISEDNNIFITGRNNQSKLFLMKVEANGNFKWIKSYASNYSCIGYYLSQTNDNLFAITGFYNITSNNRDVFLLKTDTSGYTMINKINGSIYFDINDNCIKDTSDSPLVNGLIKINNYYYLTNESGTFSIMIDTGSYNIKFINTFPINDYYVVNCPSFNYSYNVNIASQNTIVNNIDFGLQKNNCPMLTVDLSSPSFRRCPSHYFPYYINYHNNSNIVVDSVYVRVKLDSFIDIDILPALPHELNGFNDYTFFVGSVPPNSTGYFSIYYKVLCSAQLGQTLCSEARIYPKYVCENEDPQWDKSSISVTASCVGDSLVCFTIYNTGEAGNGNMQGTSTYRLFEDNALAQTGTFQINGGDSLVLCYTANGKTLRLEADQRPGHPGNSHPNVSIELCGNSANPSLGFITQFPEDDQDAFVEIDCQEVVGSYDPNEKLVKPKGITSEKFIPNGTQLEYQINFQNTGTDTAFLVVIRDTLSQYLNVETIEFGVTSHTATYKLYGHGIIEWTFNNIMLPDSNVNEAESHGFVKYKIRLKQNLDNGTLIENRAGIIFDFNAPVITNFALNKVYDTTLVVTIPIKEQINYKQFAVFPNPASSQINISSNNEIIESIELYNELGVKVDEIVSKNNITSFTYINKQNMSGLYFLKVKTKENIYTEKVVFQ